MIVNHNTNALNTYNRLNSAEKMKSSAMEKLSSGMRINKAADDAAGATISQEMKAQIRGLEQAQRNIQDGISLIQTADCGLANIMDPNLIRLRQLAVQASNGTLTQSDLQQIQGEVDQILGDINGIANNTEFNRIKLLNGTNPRNEISEGNTVGQNPNYNYENVLAERPVDDNGLFMFSTNKGYPTTERDNNKILVYGNGGTSHPLVNIDGSSYDLHHAGGVNGSYVTRMKTTKNGNSYDTVYKINNVEVTQSVKIIKDKYEIKYSVKNNDSMPHNVGVQYHIDTKLADNGDYAPFIVGGNKVEHETAYADVNLPESFIVYNQNTGEGSNAEIQACGIIKGDGIIETPSKLVIGQYSNIKDWNHNVNNSIGVSDSGYSLLWNSRQVNSNSSFAVNTFYGLSIPPTIDDPTTGKVEKEEGPYDIKLQVGANTGEEFKVQLSDVRTEKLFTNGTSVGSIKDAEKMINYVDEAMKKVSSERSKFGSYQNALEHIAKNVDNYGYNISAAESRISDTDMAKEVMEMTKNSIVQQSAQAMLQQAQKMPESIMNLMDKWKSNAEV